jgi:DNA-binding ferritin-like protein (Dps family)
MYNSYTKYKKNLVPEYSEAFGKVEDYVQSNIIDSLRQDEILNDVMDIFLSAQNDGKTAAQVTGNDITKFCTDLCSEVSIKSRIISVLEYTIAVLIICFGRCAKDLFNVLMKIMEGEKINLITYKINATPWFFLCWIGSYLAIMAVGKVIVSKFLKVSREKYRMFRYYAIAACILPWMVVYSQFFREYENGTCSVLTVLIYFICSGAAFVVYFMLACEKRKINRERLEALIEEQCKPGSRSYKNFDDLEQKKFKNINEKNVRQGKPEISFEEFLDMEEKNAGRKGPAFYFCTFVPVNLILLGLCYILCSLGHYTELIIYAVPLIVLELYVIYTAFRGAKYTRMKRLAWIKSQR